MSAVDFAASDTWRRTSPYAVLFFFGSGSANSSVTGFAVSLLIGVLTSMFTAIFISRRLLAVAAAMGMRRFPAVFSPGGRRSPGPAAEGRG